MGLELWAVAGSAAILLVLIFAQQIYNDIKKGAPWALGNREDQDFNPTSARFERAVNNHMQNALIYMPLALVVVQQGLTNWWTALGGGLFLAGRIIHSVTYPFGITHIRSGGWILGVVGSVFVGWPLIAMLF